MSVVDYKRYLRLRIGNIVGVAPIIACHSQMKRFTSVLILLTALSGTAMADGFRAHVISGSREYDSEGSLRAFTQWQRERHPELRFTYSWGSDGAESLDNLDSLADADLLIVYARRMRLEESQMASIRAYWDSGKPIIGIRTASHAFQEADNRRFDSEILGGAYEGHYGNESARVIHREQPHPTLDGVTGWESNRLYKQGDLAPFVEILQWGQSDKGREPITWVGKNGPRRTFYTSLGTKADFRHASFLLLLENAIFWVLEER